MITYHKLKKSTASSGIRVQIKTYSVQILLLLILSGQVILATLLLHYDTGIPLMDLTRDPATSNNFHPLSGFLSNLGLLIWSATTGICLFTYFYLYKQGIAQNQLLLFFGLLTLILWLDDTYLLHEFLIPLSLGVPQNVVYLGYIGLILLLLIVNSKPILETKYIFLVITLGFLDTSMIFDIIFPLTEQTNYIEDTLKFTGIIFWFYYFCIVAVYQLNRYRNSYQDMSI